MMWGDPEKALQLDESSHLATWLMQISGPAHIPWNDPRWQEVLHGYDVWVHLEHYHVAEEQNDNYSSSSNDHPKDVVSMACTNMARHAATSSNLAALAMHVARMLHGLFSWESPSSTVLPTIFSDTTNEDGNHHHNQKTHNRAPMTLPDFTQRIALIGKARATAGALQLLRIFLHHVIVQDAAAAATTVADGGLPHESILPEVLTYRCRDNHNHHHQHHHNSNRSSVDDNKQAGIELLHASLDFLSQYHVHQRSKTLLSIPELYDTTVLNLQLLVVLLSTQLYQPMISSQQRFEQVMEQWTQQQQQHHQKTKKKKTAAFNGTNHSPETLDHSNYFLDQVMILGEEAASNDELLLPLSQPSSLSHQPSSNLSDGHLATNKHSWTPQTLLTVMLNWMVHRPPAPERSIAYHHAELARSVVQAKGEKVGPDGMFDSHFIVTACKSSLTNPHTATSNSQDMLDKHGMLVASKKSSTSMILDATKGVLVLSSSIILLPFRLMSLALDLWGHHHRHRKGYDQTRRLHLKSSLQSPHRRTRDVLWLSESPLADLSSSLFLLLVNNHRYNPNNGHDRRRVSNDDQKHHHPNALLNPFRAELASLNDNRWEGVSSTNTTASPDKFALPDLPDPLALPTQGSSDDDNEEEHPPLTKFEEEERISAPLLVSSTRPSPESPPPHALATFTVNFEAIFESFGGTLHTEVGALMLYTLLQSSPTFAESIAVRSDLDTLVLPLLRTLYFATAPRHYTTMDFAGHTLSNSSNQAKGSSLGSIQNCPFRSQSQLYVILILLLLFSQDASFGPDAFRRVVVSTVPWYKERRLKDITLGSVLILTLLRSLTFNLNRLHDSFLLSNCCAVLMNLSPHVVELHDYAAMRLASVTMTCWKRYASLRREASAAAFPNDGTSDSLEHLDDIEDDDLTTPLGMHREVARTLLRLIKHCLSARNIERNLHLVYALVYHQNDFHRIVSKSDCPFRKSEIHRIQSVITTASDVILSDANTRNASKALHVLIGNIDVLREAATDERRRKQQQPQEDFTFTYEEETDPEIFFVPYVWEVIVCTVTASSMEWDRDQIRVFPLLEEEVDEIYHQGDDENSNMPLGLEDPSSVMLSAVATTAYANDVSDLV